MTALGRLLQIELPDTGRHSCLDASVTERPNRPLPQPRSAPQEKQNRDLPTVVFPATLDSSDNAP